MYERKSTKVRPLIKTTVNLHIVSDGESSCTALRGQKSGVLATKGEAKEGRRRAKGDVEGEEDEGDTGLGGFGIKQALPVEDGEPDWDRGPADTAEEYLKRVR